MNSKLLDTKAIGALPAHDLRTGVDSVPPLSKLPAELLMRVLSHLGPWPPPIAISQSQEVVQLTKGSDQPHCNFIQALRPGLTLFSTFSDFRGIHYLFNLSQNKDCGPGKTTIRILTGNRFLLPRDSFGFLEPSYVNDKRSGPRCTESPLRYLVLDLKSSNPCDLSFYSDVSAAFL